LYSATVKPILQANGRFPVLNENYESINNPNLFYAGNLAHSHDFKRSAGGFIHGFRYTARALVRILGERRTQIEQWPHVEFPSIVSRSLSKAKPEINAAHIAALAKQAMERLNVGSAAYQMVHVLGDAVVFQCDKRQERLNATYFEELPLKYFHQKFRGYPRITFSFGYFGQARPFDQSIQTGTKFEAFVWSFPGDCTGGKQRNGPPPGPEDRELFRFEESLSTQWTEAAFLPDLEVILAKRAVDSLKGVHWEKLSWGPPTFSKHGDKITPLLASASHLGFAIAAGKEFEAGEVNLWVRNLKKSNVYLQRMAPPPADQEWENHTIVHPSGGTKLESWHLDIWRALGEDDAVLGQHEVDLSNGIVQDFVVGFSEEELRQSCPQEDRIP